MCGAETEPRLRLGRPEGRQGVVDSKGIAALPDLLALPALEGRIATADAIHCLKATAQAIPEGGGDHGLARKGQPAGAVRGRSSAARLSLMRWLSLA